MAMPARIARTVRPPTRARLRTPRSTVGPTPLRTRRSGGSSLTVGSVPTAITAALASGNPVRSPTRSWGCARGLRRVGSAGRDDQLVELIDGLLLEIRRQRG